MPSVPARQAREALGARLRDLRRDVGLTGRSLARSAGWGESKVSKIEHGRQTPTEGDLRTWCRLTAADDQLADLIATARAVETMYVELRRLHRAGAARRQREYVDEEARTRLWRGFQMFLVPGLFQTPEYATARLAEGMAFLGLTGDVDETVAIRMQRQQVLYTGDHRFHAVICQAALTAGVADTAVSLGQLDRLLTVSSLTRVRLGIIPTADRHGYAPMNAFAIHDRRLVTIETVSAELKLTQVREVALYERAFNAYAGSAVYGDAARALIVAARDTLASSRKPEQTR